MKKSIILSTALSLALFSGCGGGDTSSSNVVSKFATLSSSLSTLSVKQPKNKARYDGELSGGCDTSNYGVVDNPTNGTVILHDNGYYTYLANSGFQGSDSFSYKTDINSSCAPIVVTVDVNEQNSTFPEAPSDLNITMPCPSELKLTWTDNSDNEDGFVIYQDGKPVAITGADEKCISIEDIIEEGKIYTFEVRAKNSAGVSTREFFDIKVVDGKLVKLINNIVKNGSFEDNLTNWSFTGSSEVISTLGPLVPKSGDFMAMINSNTKDSYITQTLSVPSHVSSLKFSYDVISEEPMENVGSEYDDTVELHLIIKDQDSDEVLILETVNTSTWYPIDEINFKDGDDTTFHTKWKEKEVDISQYRDKNLEIKFIVYNKGDESYDTVLLIDDVKLD